MEDTYGIETPLADLFDWGTERAPFDELEFAFPVGNVANERRALRTLRISHARRPTGRSGSSLAIGTLPLKFAITDRTQESLPRFEATLTWSTYEKFDD